MKAFEEIQDPRQLAKCDHRLVDLLVIASCTLSSGGGSFNDMELFGRTREEWLRRFLELPGEPPGHDTFNRLFQALAAERFLGALVRCVESVRVRREGEVVALDGKVLRQAWRSGESVRQVVSVWATEAGLTLGHRQVGDKSNEITAVPELFLSLSRWFLSALRLARRARVTKPQYRSLHGWQMPRRWTELMP